MASLLIRQLFETMLTILRSTAIGATLFLASGSGVAPTVQIDYAALAAAMLKTQSPVDDEEFECLALNIYHEARSEPEIGRLAVAAVTLNRVDSSAYPDSICAVVQQGGEARHRCQFSWWCDGRDDTPTETRAWQLAQQTARRSLLGLAPDPTGGATHYHATYVHPSWAEAFEPTTLIGRHRFYRTESGAPLQLASLEVTAVN